MKITMKTAILEGKDFEFEGKIFEFDGDYLRNKDDLEEGYNALWILENQDKLVEVEDNCWDKDGRYIKEPKTRTECFVIDGIDRAREIGYYRDFITFKKYFVLGGLFKDKASAEKELKRLKDLQSYRMGEIK